MARKFKERDLYIIPVWTKRLVPVTREVYAEWYKHKRYWQYQKEKDKSIGLCSFEALFSNKKESNSCYPDNRVNVEDQVLKNELENELASSLSRLSKEEFELIDAIYYKNISLRNYASKIGISHKGLEKRREKMLEKLKEELVAACM